ncbi:MAG: hypothetical protein WKF38_05020 [Candidatus Limnocylindrales bacterium]
MRVLVLNPGSSTLKASLIEAGEDVFADELVEWPPGDDDSTASDVVRDVLARVPPDPEAVGYRVVHGGMAYRHPVAWTVLCWPRSRSLMHWPHFTTGAPLP